LDSKLYSLSCRYALILCSTDEHAASILKHADRYGINDQPLTISPYRSKHHHQHNHMQETEEKQL